MTCVLNGESYDVVDLFGGPGGFDLAISALGFRPIGIEWDGDACATRVAAGLGTIHADVAEVDPGQFAGVDGLAGSPPCQSFSRAGARLGALDAPAILEHADKIRRAGHWIPYQGAGPCGHAKTSAPVAVAVSLFGDEVEEPTETSEFDDLEPGSWHDERSPLVLEPLRFADELRPEWIALEQVTDVLPLWQRFAAILRTWGYETWTGRLLAADYGVAQTRERAFLIASRVRPVGCPPPTHAKNPGLLEERPLFRWWAMAEALGWGLIEKPAGTLLGASEVGGAHGLDGGAHARQKYRDAMENGSWISRAEVQTGNNSMVTGRTGSRAGDGDVRRYSRPVSEPAPTLDTKAGNAWRVVPADGVAVGFPRRDDRGGDGFRERDFFDGDEPAPTLTAKARSWKKYLRDDAGEWQEVEVVAVNTGRNWQPGGSRDDAQTISTDEPAPSVTAKSGGQGTSSPADPGTARRNRRTYDAELEPAPTIGFGHDAAGWAWTRPATTLMGDPRIPQPGHKKDRDYPDSPGRMEGAIRLSIEEALVLQQPGHKKDRDYPDSPGRMEGAIRLSIEEALVLQSFPVDYPVQGTQTAQFRQVGDAVPPLLGLAVVEVASGRDRNDY